MKTTLAHKLGIAFAGVLALPRDAEGLSLAEADPRSSGRESQFLAVQRRTKRSHKPSPQP